MSKSFQGDVLRCFVQATVHNPGIVYNDRKERRAEHLHMGEEGTENIFPFFSSLNKRIVHSSVSSLDILFINIHTGYFSHLCSFCQMNEVSAAGRPFSC